MKQAKLFHMKTKNFFQLVLLALTIIGCTSREDESIYHPTDPLRPANSAELNNGNPTPPPGGRIPNNP